MSVWTTILGWLGFAPGTEAPPAPTEPGFSHSDEQAREEESAPQEKSSVAEVEQEKDTSVPEDAWWRCTGECLTEAPRLSIEDSEEQALAEELESFIENPDVELPHLPHVPQRVLTLLRQVNINYPSIIKVLSQDQTLSAAVLRTANSAAYAGSQETTNLEVALSRLGMKNIQGLMLKESLKAIIIRKTIGGQSPAEMLWKKSVASAVVMEHLAVLFEVKAEEAFIGGLLHDMGEMILLRMLHDYEKKSNKRVPTHVFEYVCQEHHEQMGGVLGEHWNLPSTLKPLLTQHHGEVDDEDPYRKQKWMLQLTDMLVSLMGYSERRPYDILNTEPAKALGFGLQKSHLDTLKYLPDLVKAELNLPI